MRIPMNYISLLLLWSSLLMFIKTAAAIDAINTNQSIRDGDTIVSADGTYELGFFSPGKSKNRYVGIWYAKISVRTAVWVANRETPLNDSSGVLRLTKQGSLVLLNRNRSGSVIWSSNASRTARNPVAQLLNTGNLVVKEKGDNNLENSLWQSFEHASDTLLPEAKLGHNRITGMDWYLTSWKSPDDPSRGNITGMLIPYGYPEVLVFENSNVKYRSGPWNGVGFSGVPILKQNPVFSFEFVFNDKEIFCRYHLLNSSTHYRLVMVQNGDISNYFFFDQDDQNLLSIEKTQTWLLYATATTDICERYALCGPNGICGINNSPVCDCLNGFLPKVPGDWANTDWSNGCVRRTLLDCPADGFQKLSGVKLPTTRTSWFDRSMNLEECRESCLRNCSCTAYSNLDVRDGGSGCLLWFGDLLDIRTFFDNDDEIFIRLAASELDIGGSAKFNSNSKVKKRTLVSTVLSTGILFLGVALVFYAWNKKQQKNTGVLEGGSNHRNMKEDLELPSFSMDALACATNDFSVTNKIGEGGFGPVYKGRLTDGREIAVKRLSKNSGQGIEEFKNEVMHTVKLQHRNLVKLLGCCIEGDETMLIYKFLPNKSLDFHIFGMKLSKLCKFIPLFSIGCTAVSSLMSIQDLV